MARHAKEVALLLNLHGNLAILLLDPLERISCPSLHVLHKAYGPEGPHADHAHVPQVLQRQGPVLKLRALPEVVSHVLGHELLEDVPSAHPKPGVRLGDGDLPRPLLVEEQRSLAEAGTFAELAQQDSVHIHTHTP